MSAWYDCGSGLYLEALASGLTAWGGLWLCKVTVVNWPGCQMLLEWDLPKCGELAMWRLEQRMCSHLLLFSVYRYCSLHHCLWGHCLKSRHTPSHARVCSFECKVSARSALQGSDLKGFHVCAGGREELAPFVPLVVPRLTAAAQPLLELLLAPASGLALFDVLGNVVLQELVEALSSSMPGKSLQALFIWIVHVLLLHNPPFRWRSYQSNLLA